MLHNCMRPSIRGPADGRSKSIAISKSLKKQSLTTASFAGHCPSSHDKQYEQERRKAHGRSEAIPPIA